MGVDHPFIECLSRRVFRFEHETARAVFLGDDVDGPSIDGKHAHAVPIDQQQFFARELRHQDGESKPLSAVG